LSYPELYSDERVVLQAQNVKVKSVVFEVVLTTRRLVLIDTKKNSIPPQEINLATLKDVELGENAIRDPTITISIITISGNTRQMRTETRMRRVGQGAPAEHHFNRLPPGIPDARSPGN
jgi:hypothetical protein